MFAWILTTTSAALILTAGTALITRLPRPQLIRWSYKPRHSTAHPPATYRYDLLRHYRTHILDRIPRDTAIFAPIQIQSLTTA